jgi:imidazolonepropionase-like amidohydrolase/Tol biopolymer transport system component
MRIGWKAFGLLSLLALLLGQVGAEEEEKEKKAKWDVANPPGVRSTAKLSVNEGTWLSLDLSPDGKTIVFDLLGDLYLLDIQGGQARPLTTGLEWDMQPTFSPDGRQIAFTSDRGGGDNIWILDLATGENSAKALTEETFRLLNQPTWDPSGTHIAARKHFTGTRSLGAGEIWAYHIDGGEGVQITKRANDQLDLGEPAFSPDGRYLYYSLDATGGKTFKYNKDINQGIYAIERLDRRSGEVERILSGSGGAVAPTPSPDGQTLAFVRRVRGKSQLVLLRLDDGSEKVLFDGLDRDMQETWAIHGVYPRFAWTPDSTGLVFWAQGTFHTVSAQGGQPIPIAFRLEGEREVSPAVRFPVDVAPETFSVKALRSPHKSPSGKMLVFAALGHIWSKSGTGEPHRLSQEEGNQGQPVFVGESDVLYTHWDDEKLGSIRRLNGSGSPQTLVENGRFKDPALSPDGRYLVYSKLGREALFDSRHTMADGLYVKDLNSGVERRIESSARRPHFGKDSDVVFFSKGEDPTLFVRHDLSTGKSQVLFSGKTATDFLISPDEKTVAFQDGFSLYVMPYFAIGRTTKVSGTSKNLPIKKVSTELGAYFPAWSRSGTLTWNVGPKVWSYSPVSQKKTVDDCTWTQALGRPGSSQVALVSGKVVTMNGNEVLAKGTVLIENDRIVAVGPVEQVQIPSSAFQIDCTGKTVLPGLVDVHWHGSFSDGYVFPEVNYTGLSSLSFGVTTLHDPSNDTASVFTAREMQMVGRLLAPRIFSTGTILYGAKAPGYYAEVKSLKDALGHLKRLKTWGAVSVKSYNQPRREQRQQVLEAARQTKMMVVPEGGSLFQHNMTMVVDGHTGVEHALPVAKIYRDVTQLWSQTEVGYTPTLGVAYGGVWGENYWYVKTDVWDDERLNRFVPREVIDPASRRRVQAPDEEYNHLNAAAGAKALADKGVSVNLGAHGQREGLAAHWELWMLVQGGMTPHQALRCGTINGARYLGLEGDIGSLQVGKLADIIVVAGDPLQDIRQSKFVEYTILGGKVYQADTMKRIGPGQGLEPKLWWRSK